MRSSLLVFALALGSAAGSYVIYVETGGTTWAARPCDECYVNDDSSTLFSERITCNGGVGSASTVHYTDLACTTVDAAKADSSSSFGTQATYTLTYFDTSATFYVGLQWSSNANDCPTTGSPVADLSGSEIEIADVCSLDIEEDADGSLTTSSYMLNSGSGDLTYSYYSGSSTCSGTAQTGTWATKSTDCTDYTASDNGYRTVYQTINTAGSTSGSSALAPSIALAAAVALATLWY